MEILIAAPRVAKRGHVLLVLAVVCCLPPAVAWGGVVLYVSGAWAAAAKLVADVPLWAQGAVMAGCPLLAGLLAGIGYVRHLRDGHGDWRLLAVVAVSAALIVGTTVTALTLYEPTASSSSGRGGGGGGGGGGGSGASGGTGTLSIPSAGGSRPAGGSRGGGARTGGSRPSGGRSGGSRPPRG